MKPNPLNNVLTYPPEAWQAIAVLDFDDKGWRDIHEAIQSGEPVPDIVIELKHASDVLAAIQRGDEVSMLRALVLMKDVMAQHKEVEGFIAERDAFKRGIKALEPLAREGFKVRAGRRKARKALERNKDPGEKEVFQNTVDDIQAQHPRWTKGRIQQEAAEICCVSARTIRRNTTIK